MKKCFYVLAVHALVFSIVFGELSFAQVGNRERKFTEHKIEKYLRIVKRNPGTEVAARAKLQIGDEYAGHLEEYEKAIELYEEMIRDYPNTEWERKAMLHIGMTYQAQHKYNKAIKIYKSCVKKYLNLDAQVALEAKEWISYCEKRIKEEAKSLQEIGKLEKIIVKNPGSREAVQAQYQIGDIYSAEVNDYEQAIIAYQKVINNYPDSKLVISAMLRVALCYVDTNFGKMVEICQKIIRQHPQSTQAAEASLLIADGYSRFRDYKQAIQLYRKVIRDFPSEVELVAGAQYAIGDCYYSIGDDGQAKKEFQKVIQRHPNTHAATNAREQIKGME